MSFLTSLLRPMAYVSVPALVLRSASTWALLPSPARYYIRVGLYLTSLTAVALSAILVGAGMSIVGMRYDVNYVVARTFYAVAGTIMDIEVEVEGEEHLNTSMPAVLMCNHQSMLDVLPVGRIFPRSAVIMSKKSMQFSPLGPFMSLAGTIFIDRGNNARAMQSMNAAGATMKSARVGLWIFPEGTRHSQEVPDLLPFKKGGFHLAVQAGLPIVPIVFENYWRIYRQNVFETGKIRVRVLPPIPTEGLTADNVPDLANDVRDQMLEALREISVEVGPRAKYSSPTPQPEPAPPQSTATSAAAEARKEPDLEGTVPPAQPTPGVLAPSHSRESLSSSTNSSSTDSHRRGSASGAETEEDEGMVLVGRPRGT